MGTKKITIIGLFALTTLVGLFLLVQLPKTEERAVDYSQVWQALSAQEIAKVEFLRNGWLKVEKKDGSVFRSIAPAGDDGLLQALREDAITVSSEPRTSGPGMQILTTFLPIAVIVGFLFYFSKTVRSGQQQMGKAKAKKISKQQAGVDFSNVAGVDESKYELQEVVDFLRNPKKYTSLGAKIPRGVLLVGPPGTGKTLLARAVAGEAGVPFFSISGADFVDTFVGIGASRVRDLFAQAQKSTPCLIFIDEIDAVGRKRGAGHGGGHDEREQTLNQLLVEMDGIGGDAGVITIAATNRPDILDPALLRPGRFDRQVTVPVPDIKGREKILEVHTSKIPLSKDVSLNKVAKATPGFSGAQLANLVNEATLFTARENRKEVTFEDLEEARDKVLIGIERKSAVISEKSRRLTAIHESGHALASILGGSNDPLHKISIIPRGQALGVTVYLPEEDQQNYQREEILARICSLLGGRAAEEIVLGKISIGAGNDLNRVMSLARRMICEWGMSEKFGPVAFDEGKEVFLGRDLAQTRSYSDRTAYELDLEVQRLIQKCYEQTKELLQNNREKIDLLADALLESETLDASTVHALIDGHLKTKTVA